MTSPASFVGATDPGRAPSAAAPLVGALGQVRAALDGFIDAAAGTTPAAAALWEAVRRASTDGKLMRPRLLLATHRALGGADHEAAVRASAAVELLHTAFLIHDDVIDHDWTRRGGPTVAARFRDRAVARGRTADLAEQIGVSAAIIAGDLAIAGAARLIATASSDPRVTEPLVAILDEAVSATAAGELMDVELASAGSVSVEDVLAMYEAKTSVYTFCAPLQLGATLAGADPAVVASLDVAGRHLGVAYQVTDDLLGLFGDPTTTGKPTDSDARERKQTVLVALLSGSLADRPLSRRDAASLRDAVERSGARAAAVDLATVRTLAAEEALLPVPAALRQALAPLLDGLLDRSA